MAKNTERKVEKAPKSTTSNTEGVVTSVQLDEVIIDPHDPRAVQTPVGVDQSRADGLSVHNEPSPNEVSGDEAIANYNPHTGDVVSGKLADDEEVPAPAPPVVATPVPVGETPNAPSDEKSDTKPKK